MEIPKPPYHPDVRPTRPSEYHKPKPSPEFRARFIALQKRILQSPTCREPSAADVELFEASYNKLCRSRWGSLPRAKR